MYEITGCKIFLEKKKQTNSIQVLFPSNQIIQKYSNKLSMKALVEKSMLRKIKKREEQISTLPSFTLISQRNPKELKETQGN